jgi:cation:H+ antiporter
MEISASIVLLAGLAALVVGAEMVLRGGSRFAVLMGVRPLVIGLTVVSIGTSIPELAVGITASLEGSGSISVGNIAGTNMVNILFILGLSALFRPLMLHLQVIKIDLPVMVIAAALMAGLAWDGVLSPLDGILLLAVAVVYTVLLLRQQESTAVQKEFEDMCGGGMEKSCGDLRLRKRNARKARLKNAVLLAAGMGISVIGAVWTVDGAVDIARALKVSEAIIGLTVVAIGTSSPELVTTIIATLRNERDVAVGNLLGSSIYNILVILGLICIATPGSLPVERQLLMLDIPLMAGVALACVPVFWSGKCISRLEGGLGVAAYLIYLLWLVLFRA